MTSLKIDSESRIRQALARWYAENQRRLPWRGTRDAYAVWVSEVMLQQTQVNTVIPYYERFIKRFGSIRKLATATDRQVLKAWEGLGYYARVRHLHQAVKIVAARYDGHVPSHWEDFHAFTSGRHFIVRIRRQLDSLEAVVVTGGRRIIRIR